MDRHPTPNFDTTKKEAQDEEMKDETTQESS